MEELRQLNGTTIYYMLRQAFTSLSFNESYLNDINTFPVSDSDTGTNMKRTLQKGLLTIDEHQTAGEVLSIFAHNMSLESRGNSGFIISQYFIGLSEVLKEKIVLTLDDLKEAIIHAYKVAYAAVVNPMEGTMLTVMREGAKEALAKLEELKNQTFSSFFKVLSESIFHSVLNTQKQMELLKSNNVVDSGALGFYLVIDGMRKYFDETNPYFNCDESELLPRRATEVQNPLTFYRYCTEFTVDLKEEHTKEYFTNLLYPLGDSVVVAINKNLLKVHIHTNIPETIFDEFRRYGNMVFTKVDDLFKTPEFSRLETRKHLDYAVVVFTYGKESALLYERLGADAAFAVPTNHKISEEEIRNLLASFLEGNVIVYSADKQIQEILKSMQWWSSMRNLVVVECNGLTNTFFKFASSMFDGSFAEFKQQLSVIKKVNNTEFRIQNGKNLHSTLKRSLSPGRLSSFSTLVIFGGESIKQEDIDTLTEFFVLNNQIEYNYFPGGQEDSIIVIGAM